MIGTSTPTDTDLAILALRVRRRVVEMTGTAGSGHPGGSLSVADILTTLYFSHMRFRPDDPRWPERDRLVLSKGHAAPALYATLELVGTLPPECGLTLRKLGSNLQGHPDCRRTPGVEISTGSLGQGLSIANGMALAARLDGSSHRVFCVLGDGECDEGQVWEAAMLAAHYRLGNMVAIVDRNGQQIDGWTKDVMDLEPFADKWHAFGWHTVDADGHSFESLRNALAECDRWTTGPSVIVAHTIKGKGVSFMENNAAFHGKAPNRAELQQALQEIDERLAVVTGQAGVSR